MYGIFPIDPPESVEMPFGTARLTHLVRTLTVDPRTPRPVIVLEMKGYMEQEGPTQIFRQVGPAVDVMLDRKAFRDFFAVHGTDFALEKVIEQRDARVAEIEAAKEDNG